MAIETTHPNETVTSAQARTAGIATFLLAVGMPIIGILTANARGAETAPGLGDWVFVGIVGLAAIGTFTLLVPWALRDNGSRTGGLIVSTIGFATSFIAFWTMLPLILGAAGAFIGYKTLHDGAAGSRRGMAVAAIALGLIAMVVSVAATIATS